jgi:hypothetical protein
MNRFGYLSEGNLLALRERETVGNRGDGAWTIQGQAERIAGREQMDFTVESLPNRFVCRSSDVAVSRTGSRRACAVQPIGG